MDFTLTTYRTFLSTLSNQGFSFSTFAEFQSNVSNSTIVLRHDVDALPENSLRFAKIQADMGIKGSYYFRTVPGSWNEGIIKEIANLGHEIGYHYEDLGITAQHIKGTTAQRRNGVTAQGSEREEKLVRIAIESFKENLERMRQIVPIKTICMHGSPMSRWDSRLLWKYYDYHDFGIVGEPYFDIDFNKVLYLTDTGRRWDGDYVSIRDKVVGQKDIETKRLRDEEKSLSPSVSQSLRHSGSSREPRAARRTPFPKFHTTFDIIKVAEQGKLPDKIMMTFHPQRWTDKRIPWVKELVWQNVKNVGKFFLVKIR